MRVIQQKLWDKYFTAAPAQRRQYDAVSNAVKKASKRYSIDPKMDVKWRKRTTTTDVPIEPEFVSTVLTAEEEAIAVAFR